MFKQKPATGLAGSTRHLLYKRVKAIVLAHPPFLPDLALYDFYLFSKIPFMLKICPAQNFQFCNIFESFFIVAPIVCGIFFCLVFLFCSICVLSSFAITSLGKREDLEQNDKM